MTPRVDRAARTPAERRALQDALAWPIAATLLVGAGIVVFLPRLVPPRFLALAVGGIFALTTITLVVILAVVVERWLRRHAATMASDAERRVQALGIAGLATATGDSAMLPVASAFADAGARAAFRSAEQDTSELLAQLGRDHSLAAERGMARLRESLATVALPDAARQALGSIDSTAAALRQVTAAVPLATFPIDVIPELRAVVADLESTVAGPSINSIMDSERGLVVIDGERFRQNVRDLLVLARSASPPESVVTLHVSRIFRSNIEETPVRRTGDSRLTIVPRASGDALRAWVLRAQPSAEVLSIVITDAGAVATAHEQQHAFDAFALERPGDPLGVTLATVRRTVLAARGTMWVDGSREGGTAVHVLLPIVAG